MEGRAHRQAEEALRESEERLRLALAVGELATWDWELPSGQVVWSEAHYRMQGYRVGEVAPSCQAWLDRVHPEDRASTEAGLRQAREQRAPYRHEFRTVHPDGSVHWLLAQARFFFDAQGTPVRLIGVMRDISEQKRAELALRGVHAQLEGKVAQRTQALRELLAHVEYVQDEERRRIARELHDSLGQSLSSLALALHDWERRLELPQERARAAALRALMEQVDRELDRMIFTLRPTALEDCGLADGIASYLQSWQALNGLSVDLAMHGVDGVRLPKLVEAAAFRVMQEALSNVVKHARAARISVTVERLPDELLVCIEDDGVGFEPRGDDAQTPQSHWGLLGAQERVEALGGRFVVESAPGAGAAILFRLPVPR